MPRRSRSRARPRCWPRRPPALLAALVAAVLLAPGVACRPDTEVLLVRLIEEDEPVELPDGYTLVVDERDGATLRGVRITGPAKTCEGTLELLAPEVRVEPADGEAGPRLVLERPVAEEVCGGMKAVTRHDRLTWYLEGGGDPLPGL